MVSISGEEKSKVPGIRKAAIVMVMIGDEATSALLREMDEDEVQQIGQEIARVHALTPEEAEGILD